MSAPVRLQKEVNMSVRDSIEDFIIAHATFFLALGIILMLAVFITFCVMICGASATDSGLQYNQMEQI
ncbi:hypothetical protein, partial [Methanobrevibacter sp.]|uniref:hypothetical protein n=1 Tax=Methanobrevibacter sp. TaxID=66852 RepID=UPI00386501DE